MKRNGHEAEVEQRGRDRGEKEGDRYLSTPREIPSNFSAVVVPMRIGDRFVVVW